MYGRLKSLRLWFLLSNFLVSDFLPRELEYPNMILSLKEMALTSTLREWWKAPFILKIIRMYV